MRRAPDRTTSANYEEVQNWNALTRWLHSYRYRHALDTLRGHRSIFEIGSANGKLFGLLDERQPIEYIGVEPYPVFAATSRERYGARPNFRVIEATAMPALDQLALESYRPDAVVALETLEHILEPEVVRIIERIAAMRPKVFVASVPVEIGPAILAKNVGSALAGYGRHRSYGWRNTFWATFNQLDKLPPHGSSHLGFDWRWLAQTIRHHFKILEMRRFPFPFLPVSCSATVFMICRPWTPDEKPRVT